MTAATTLLLGAVLGLGSAAPPAGHRLDPEPERAMHRVRVHVVEVLMRKGRSELALEAAGQLARAQPDDAPTQAVLGRALEANGLHDEALEAYARAARLDRRDPVSRDLMGRLLTRLGRAAEAVPWLRRATDLAPFEAGVWNDLGFTLLIAGDAPRAVEALRRSVELDPADRRARVNLGFALAAARRDEEALRSFRALHSAADAYANLGLAVEWRGDRGRAVELYRAALALEPEHRAANANLDRLRDAEGTEGNDESP